MLIFDAHNDLLTKISDSNESLYKNSCHIDIYRMLRKSDFDYLLGCAIFVSGMEDEALYKRANSVIDYFETQMEMNKEVVGKLNSHKKISIILSLEGGECLGGDTARVEHFYNRGVRTISLTWNNSNVLAGGCDEPLVGISKVGKAVLQKMNELGIILDLSHISEKSFFDAFEVFGGKIIASHSNAKKICNHKRNLGDDQIRLIARNGGVIGVNLYPKFLTESGEATITDVIRQIDYIASVGGIDSVGFGFDFDGVDSLPHGIRGIEDVYKIIDEMARINYSESDIMKICGGNFYRMFYTNKKY